MRAQLLQAGVVVGDVVAVDEACSILREMDAVLTGFPPSTPEHEAIAHYQVSSKIGDALSVGRPVLVPRGHSVADLVDVPGVFLFDHDDFAAQLEAALSHQGRISLPDDFTLPGANAGWRAALDEAAGSPPAASLLQPTWSERSTFPVSARRRNFLLHWKKNDA